MAKQLSQLFIRPRQPSQEYFVQTSQTSTANLIERTTPRIAGIALPSQPGGDITLLTTFDQRRKLGAESPKVKTTLNFSNKREGVHVVLRERTPTNVHSNDSVSKSDTKTRLFLNRANIQRSETEPPTKIRNEIEHEKQEHQRSKTIHEVPLKPFTGFEKKKESIGTGATNKKIITNLSAQNFSTIANKKLVFQTKDFNKLRSVKPVLKVKAVVEYIDESGKHVRCPQGKRFFIASLPFTVGRTMPSEMRDRLGLDKVAIEIPSKFCSRNHIRFDLEGEQNNSWVITCLGKNGIMASLDKDQAKCFFQTNAKIALTE